MPNYSFNRTLTRYAGSRRLPQALYVIGAHVLGFGKTYDDEFLELYGYLTQQWEMKPGYAKPFLTAYKKSIGKIFSKGNARMASLEASQNPEARLLRYANLGQEYDFALVGQAYYAYMGDLRRGRHVGTPVEKAIWAILANRSDLVASLDNAFARWIDEKHEEKFPGLFAEVFEYSGDDV